MPHKSSWCLIVNPLASSGRGLRLYPRVSKLLRDAGMHFEPRFVEYPFHAVELTVSAICEGYTKIAILGGDGTLHDVVNGLFVQKCVPPNEVSVAFLSTSRPRGWKRSRGSKISYAQMVEAMSLGQTKLQDVGVVSYEEAHYRQERYMALAASVGFEALVVKRFAHLRNKGATRPARYAWNFIRAMFRYRPAGARVWIDEQLSYDSLLLSMSIKLVGTGGGTFEVSFTEPLSIWRVLLNAKQMVKNRGGVHSRDIKSQGSTIRIESIPNMPLEVDGEVLGDTPIEFRLVKEALRMVVVG